MKSKLSLWMCASAFVSVFSTAGIAVAQHAEVSTSTDVRTASVLAKRVTLDLDRVSLEAAINALASRSNVRIMYHQDQVRAIGALVSLHVVNVPLGEAFLQVLRGTTFYAEPVTADAVNLRQGDGVAVQGSIVGKITNGKTGQPVPSALVTVDNNTTGITSGEDGRFRFVGLTAGEHVLRVRMIGYMKATKTVTVTEGQTASVDFALEVSVSALDQVVVTGTVAATELKAVPNAMTIITGQELERRGITRIDQLFHGDVPGITALDNGLGSIQPGIVSMESRGVVGLSLTSAPIKTYVDGVELSDPRFLGLIDPKSIERIEILTGPQASTIYGSNAINGVMQVFTKRGTSVRPQLTLNLESGLVQNSFSSAMTPQHNYSAQLSGIDGHVSYNVGGSWVYMGPWTPTVHTGTTSGFGGVRLQQGPVTIDVNLRRVLGTNWSNSLPWNESWNVAVANGLFAGTGTLTVPSPLTYTTNTQTLGFTTTYVPVTWWSHTLTVGTDGTTFQDLNRNARYYFPSDSLLRLDQSSSGRTTVAYSTTAKIPVTSLADLVVTVGADGWHSLATSLSATPTNLSGTLISSSYSVSRQPSHDRGMFIQGMLGVNEQLFLTYGLREEWNPNYGNLANPNGVPRYGIAWTHDLGPVTTKLRASYGHSTRPPGTGLKQGIMAASDPAWANNVVYYGNFPSQLGNPDLLPEQQQGGEGGLEVYWGNRASLVVTHYNQTVDNLIQLATVDSVDELPAIKEFYGDRDWQWPAYIKENLNLGSVRNTGWEGRATAAVGYFTFTGTYSWTKSRLIGITPKYRAQFSQYVIGSVFGGFPEHTHAASVTYAKGGTSILLNVQGHGTYSGQNGGWLYNFFNRYRLPAYQSPIMYVSGLWKAVGGAYTTTDVNASQRLTSTIEGMLQIQNLTNQYWDPTGSAGIGRQGLVGLRLRF